MNYVGCIEEFVDAFSPILHSHRNMALCHILCHIKIGIYQSSKGLQLIFLQIVLGYTCVRRN